MCLSNFRIDKNRMEKQNSCSMVVAQQMKAAPANEILHSLLSYALYKDLSKELECVSLPLGTIIHREYDPIKYVYFPNQAMISLVSTMENGATTEISLIGKEGMVGLPAILGGQSINYTAIVQVTGTAMRIKAEALKKQFEAVPKLRKIVLLYVQARLTYISQLAACNRQHKIESRLARWLLLVQDCLQTDHLPLTQEFMANMLGTNRAGVTLAAQKLQSQDIISYSRGNITVKDRQGLESSSCECYSIMTDEIGRLAEMLNVKKPLWRRF